MTPDQQFILDILTLLVPLLSSIIVIIASYVNYRISDKTHIAVQNVTTKLAENTALTQSASDKADASYMEANHANLKIQSVQDSLDTALGITPSAITARSLREQAVANNPFPSDKGV